MEFIWKTLKLRISNAINVFSVHEKIRIDKSHHIFCTNITKDLKDKMVVFDLFLKNLINGNMDEIPISFDMSSSFIVKTKRSVGIIITTRSNENHNFTIVLCTTLDDMKCQLWVISKQKIIPKNVF